MKVTLGKEKCYCKCLVCLEISKGLMEELNSVWSSYRQWTRASLWSECGQWEGCVSIHDSFYLHPVDDSAHHRNNSQERQHSRGHQTESPGIRLQVLSSYAHTSAWVSRLQPLHLLSRVPGQCLNIVMEYVCVCPKATLPLLTTHSVPVTFLPHRNFLYYLLRYLLILFFG